MRLNSKEYYQRIISFTADGYCIIEKVSDEPLDFCYIEANPAFIAHVGTRDVVGKTIRQVFPNESHEHMFIYNQILKTGEPQRFECGHVSSGSIFEAYAFRIDKAHRCIVIYSKDIAQRKIRENSLKGSEKKYRP